MASHIQSFTKGIDKDSSVNKYPNNAAYHIENFRFITDEGLTNMSLENIKGTTLSFSLDSGYLFWGHTTIRNTLVVLAINSNKELITEATDRIYTATINENGSITGLSYIYEGALELSIDEKVTDMLSRYESDTIQKIYWTTEIAGLKFANIADPDISSKPSTWFDYSPVFIQSNIVVDSIGTGNIKSGAVQYAYQFYNLYGISTRFTIPSNLIPLSESAQSGDDSLFVGSDIETNSGKSVKITINNLDTNFNRIRVVRLLHTSLLNEPEVTIIYDSSFSSTLTITDAGVSNFGTLTAEEFRFISYEFIPKNLETKNNILFASNVKENVWDIDYDARAYRYDSAGVCYLFDANQANLLSFNYSQLSANPNLVPEEHDCYNIYNDVSINDGQNLFKYNGLGSGTEHIGGKGLNVSYGFEVDFGTLDENVASTNSIYTNTSTASTSNINSIRVSQKIGYLRDEIYSFGIVLYNNKNQRSYVKWIGDIRFPSIFDNPLYFNHSVSATYKNLYINFTIANLPADCTAFQIVRCERKAEDRTILAQGIIAATRTYEASGSRTWECPAIALPTVRQYKNPNYTTISRGQLLNQKILEFISPEISYGNNITYGANDFIEICGALMYASQVVKTKNDGTPFIYDTSKFWYSYNKGLNVSGPLGSNVAIVVNKLIRANVIHQRSNSKIPISTFVKADFNQNGPTNEGDFIIVGSNNYENYIRQFGYENMQGHHATCGVIAINNVISFSDFPTNDTSYPFGLYFPLVNYKRPIKGYGGVSYINRTTREYIPCSDLYYTDGSPSYSAKSTQGDTFVSYFDFQRAFVSGLTGMTTVDENLVDIYKFPVETSINTRWQSQKTFTQAYGNSTNTSAVLTQEKAGSWAKANVLTASYTQEKDLYSYNSVYSKQNNVVKFIPKPLDSNDNKTYDCRIHYSDRKFNNENIDSWTIYRPLNFKDVDSHYGPINATVNYNHDFIFFQDNAVGIASIEERELLQSTTGSTSVIGQGGILSRYDYITTAGGCQDKDSVVMGRYKLYWYDRMNNSLFSFDRSSGVNNISKLEGLHSWFNNIGVNNINTVISGVDPKFNEIYFTVQTNTTFYTLVYSELYNLFTQFVAVNAYDYINYENYLYSIGGGNSVYLHNSGEYGRFHGVLRPSKLTLVINPRQMLINKFDVLEFLTRVTSGSTELRETFTTLRIRNGYQDTGIITLQEDVNIKERLRKWRFNSIWSTDEYNSRFKDSYVTIDLEFTNNGTKHIVVSDIIMLYQESFSK